MAELDREGHSTFGTGGITLPGLCHCARGEAHRADPADTTIDLRWSVPRPSLRDEVLAEHQPGVQLAAQIVASLDRAIAVAAARGQLTLTMAVDVDTALQAKAETSTGVLTGQLDALMGIPIVVDRDWPAGKWELRRDGDLIASSS